MKNFNLLLKELLGDVRALGSWVFFLLFVVRVMILPNQWPLLNQLLIAGFLILIVELLNTAIETILNRISVEENDLTKYAKDAASGAVLFSLILWLIIWSLVLIY